MRCVAHRSLNEHEHQTFGHSETTRKQVKHALNTAFFVPRVREAYKPEKCGHIETFDEKSKNSTLVTAIATTVDSIEMKLT